MSVIPLFLDKEIEFEKTAGSLTKLRESTDSWPQDIMQEAYRRLPFLSNFEVSVTLDKMDEARGTAFGSIEVRPHSEMPEMARQSHLGKVHIPIIIENHMLFPFDVFLYGERYSYLTEGRLRECLFRADMFDSAQDRPPEALLGTDLQPPALSGQAYGGVKLGQASTVTVPPVMPAAPAPIEQPAPMTAGNTPQPKIASILHRLNGRVLKDHVDRVKTAMQDPSIQRAFSNGSDASRQLLTSALRLEPSDPVKTASRMIDSISPSTVQVSALPTGKFLVKWANAEAYAPQQQEMTPQQATDIVGTGELSQQLQQDGSVTVNPQAQATDLFSQDTETKVADQFGMWLVQDSMGNQLLGWVFPRLYSVDLEPMSVSMFTNGSQHAMQPSIAGRLVGKATDIPSSPPKGYGAFFFVEGGSAHAFVPMQVTGTFTDPSGMVHYTARTDMGEEVTFFFSNNVRTMARVGQGQVIVPSSYKWLPLKAKTDLVEDPSIFTKTAARVSQQTVEILGSDGVFSFNGPAVSKLASAETKFISRRDAEFLGSTLGIERGLLKLALDKANSGFESVHIGGVQVITPLHEKLAKAKTAVQKELSSLKTPIRNHFLLKEAAFFDDALTVDSILGLGFINAENVATFVDALPTLNEVSSKLAEMLIAVRLGLKNIPEVAVERALVALEDVIKGLNALKQREVRFGG